MVTQARKHLKRTWTAFFGAFGALKPVQQQALEPLLAGKNTVILAPAASGKTEAVFAPLLERLFHFNVLDESGITLLYVAPTRALVNDMFGRLQGPCELLGLSLARRTGDKKELSMETPQQVVLTTPESLDSMLCRGHNLWNPRMAVVLDELHLLDCTARGDQLRIVLRRVARQPGTPSLRFAALSATFGDPEQVGGRYFSVDEVVRVPADRHLAVHTIASLDLLPELMLRQSFRKVLAFTKSRMTSERVAEELGRLFPGQKVCVHHGSLHRGVRLEAEEAMKQWSSGICVATSTLEVGIDIGDIDAVLLVDLPDLPSTFQQRIARGSRREGSINVIALCPDPESERFLGLLVESAENGFIEEKHYQPELSVVVQQLFSVLYERRRGVSVAELEDLFSPLCDGRVLAKITAHLESLGYLKRSAAAVIGTERLMDLGEKGLIHSNVPDQREVEVVERESGRTIARAAVDVGPGSRILLEGRIWQVTGLAGGKLLVEPAESSDGRSPFARRSQAGAFVYLLPPEFRGR